MVVGHNVTHLGARLRHLGQFCLNMHQLHHLLLCFLFIEVEELEHAHHMFLVGLTDGCSGVVGVEIIFFLPESDTALSNVQNVHLCILLVGIEAIPHGHAVGKRSVFQLDGFQFFHRLGCIDLLDERHHGRHALLVAAH